MTISVGFILLTHKKTKQIHRLIDHLNKMFNYPPIVCHHDFSKCDLSVDTLPKNISFVHPHLQTAWGEFSIVEATVQAIKLMYESANCPDWFILLSGSDYPIKTAKKILGDLTLSKYDAHINHEEIIYKVYQQNVKMGLIWQILAHQRYCSYELCSIPLLNNLKVRLEHPLLTKPFLPFSYKLRCFGGGQWFSANKRAAEYIIKFHSHKNALTSHYRRRMFADESYFQTILANAPHLNLKNDDYRYVDWSTKAAHPKTIVIEDLPHLLASSCHFARKFDIDIDSNILDQLDIITLA
ncbi:glycosyl transferase [Trichormus variabilis SAG 1403-4b]|uniref:Peptide O-xylosyltransferase n=2 Tax=Anabaena variabilis TaxID=264691 RepID=A0A3S1IJV6_ANAVA|nr:glycosyl transferase [Trichormus variabilis SAG 1403-4b]